MSSFLFALLAFLYLTPSSAFINMADVDCGITKMIADNRISRIVNGIDAGIGEFPWIASLKVRGQNMCGGVILNKNWILTASHCFFEKNGVKKEPTQFQIGVGEHYRVVDDERTAEKAQIISVKEILHYPSYVSSRQGDDIALIRIHSDIEWNDFVQPVCLPADKSSLFSGATATVAGWGLKGDGHLANELQKVDVPILANDDCQRWYKEEKKTLTIVDGSLCAGFEEGGKDACRGDSGGPLVIKKDGRQIVVGLVSTGFGCAKPKLPGIYTRVNHYLDWIKSSLSINKN